MSTALVPNETKSRFDRWFALFAALLYLCISIAWTYPVILHLKDHVVGDPQSDIWSHLWGYWRTERALLEEGTFPLQEDYLNYPETGKLYHIDLLNSLVMVPLKKIFGMAAGYNLLVWLQLMLGGMAMFWLLRALLIRPGPAAIGGMLWAFSPYVTSFPLASGVSERLLFLWIPLYCLFFVKFLATGRLKHFILACLCCVLGSLACWKYGFFLYLLSLTFVCYRLAVLLFDTFFGKKEETRLKALTHQAGALLLKRILPFVLVCGLAVAPIFYMGFVSVKDDSALSEHSIHILWNGKTPLKELNRFVWTDFVKPFKSSLYVNQTYDRMYQTIYLGFLPLLLTVFSLFNRKRYSRFFLPAAGLFILLTLGPNLSAFMNIGSVPSPVYTLFAYLVPFATLIETPWEYVLMVHFFLAAGAAIGLDWFVGKMGTAARGFVLGAAALAALFELTVLSPAPFPAPLAKIQVPSFYYRLAEDAERYAVFDLPSRRPDSPLIPEEYFYYQTIHHKPIPYSINYGWIGYDPFWFSIRQYQQGFKAEPNPNPELVQKALNHLIVNNFRYVILHKKNITAEKQGFFVKFFTRMLGAPVMEDADLMVFTLPAPPKG